MKSEIYKTTVFRTKINSKKALVIFCFVLLCLIAQPFSVKQSAAELSTLPSINPPAKLFDDLFIWKENGFDVGSQVKKALANDSIDPATKKMIERTLRVLRAERNSNPSRLAYSSGLTRLISKMAEKPKNRKPEDYIKDVKQALAELRQAEYILQTDSVLQGSQLVINAGNGNAERIFTDRANLPAIDVADVEADCYFMDKRGFLHLHEVKNTFRSLTQKLREEIQASNNTGKVGQFERYGQWVNLAKNRNVMVVIRDSDQDFYRLLEEDYIYLLAGCVRGQFAKPFLQIDNRIYSISDLRQMSMDSRRKMAELVEQTEEDETGEDETDLINKHFNSVEKTFQTLRKSYGTKIE